MATFTAFVGTSDELGELVAITKGTEASGATTTSATFNYLNAFGDTDTVTLTGTGFSGPISATWHITAIDGFINGVHFFTVNNFAGVMPCSLRRLTMTLQPLYSREMI